MLSVEEKQRLVSDFGTPTDAPTFARSTNQFINDFYYVMSRRQP